MRNCQFVIEFERAATIEQPDVSLMDKIGQRMLAPLTQLSLVLHGVQKDNPIDAGIFRGKTV